MTDLQQTPITEAQQVGFGLDKGWIIISAGFVFFMLVGLGLMEIGSIRRKNSRIVWYKILLNLISTIFWWWILGYAWAFGNTNRSFVGAERFYAGNKWGDPNGQIISGQQFAPGQGLGNTAQYAPYVWFVAIAAVSTTVATAIITERVTMKTVILFNLAYNMIILPFVFAWTFGLGFLVSDIGYVDYAGSWIIWGNAATAGLAGLLFIRPRYNRYQRFPTVLPPPVVDPTLNQGAYLGQSEFQRNLPSVAFDKMRGAGAPYGNVPYAGTGAPEPLSTTAFTAENIIKARKRQDEDEYETFHNTNYGLICLGAIITFIGFIFFNAGASQGLQVFYLFDYAEHAAATTLLAGMGGALLALIFLSLFARRRPARENYVTVARAFVAGMVCVCAASNVYRPWAGFVAGLCGAWAYLIMAYVMHRSNLDDPTEFFSIFFAAGFAGIIVAAFLNIVSGIFYQNATEGEILIWQVLSWGIMLGWTFIISIITFWLAYMLRILRVGLKCEIVGYDYIDGARHLDYPDRDILTLEKQRKKEAKGANVENAEAL